MKREILLCHSGELSMAGTDNLTGVDAAGNSIDLAEFNESSYATGEIESILSAYSVAAKETGSVESVASGDIVKGRILQINDKDVYVDISFKSEGAVSLNEFRKDEVLNIGDEIEVYVERLEDHDGNLILSKSRADFLRVWDTIYQAYEDQSTVQGRLVRRIKGGVVVDLFGVDSFLPGSQIDLRQIPDMDAIIGQTFDFRVIKVNKARRNIVVSRRVILEEERAELREKVISDIEKGQTRKGIVKNITDFGAFIDLGGVDGLLHITDMSWGRVNDPRDILELHQEIDVMILDYNENKERISLGLKQLSEHPWKGIEGKFPEGERVRGKIVSITEYGAFMELEKGIEGLIHISEMSWTQHVKHPSKVVSIGDVVEAVVLKIDKDSQKISLGLKQLEPDPWENIRDEFPIGTIVPGKIRNLASFGAFVELKEGIDGLIHISDMSWTKKISTPSEMFGKGDTVDVKVIDIDEDKRRISLGIKQLQDDPWSDLATKFVVGTTAEVKVARMLDRGMVVDLGDDVEGFVPLKEVGQKVKHPVLAFEIGDSVNTEVIEFDLEGRKIVLSVAEYLKSNADEKEAFLAKYPVKKDFDLEAYLAKEAEAEAEAM